MPFRNITYDTPLRDPLGFQPPYKKQILDLHVTPPTYQIL